MGGEAACFLAESSAFPLVLLFKLCLEPEVLTPLTASAPLIVAADMLCGEARYEGSGWPGVAVCLGKWQAVRSYRTASLRAPRVRLLARPAIPTSPRVPEKRREREREKGEGEAAMGVLAGQWWWAGLWER